MLGPLWYLHGNWILYFPSSLTSKCHLPLYCKLFPPLYRNFPHQTAKLIWLALPKKSLFFSESFTVLEKHARIVFLDGGLEETLLLGRENKYRRVETIKRSRSVKMYIYMWDKSIQGSRHVERKYSLPTPNRADTIHNLARITKP